MSLKLDKVPLKNKIASILMQRIIDNKISVGDKLKEAHLAKEFGVSQAPVREAIISLVTKGILKHIPNVGTYVKSHTKQELIETYQVREALELYACRFIPNGADLLLIKEMYQNILNAIKIHNFKELVKYDQIFHELLLKSCNNLTITDIWKEQYTKSMVSHIVEDFNATLDEIANLHLSIIEAIEEQSVEKCNKAIRYHYQTIIKNIKDKQ